MQNIGTGRGFTLRITWKDYLLWFITETIHEDREFEHFLLKSCANFGQICDYINKRWNAIPRNPFVTFISAITRLLQFPPLRVLAYLSISLRLPVVKLRNKTDYINNLYIGIRLSITWRHQQLPSMVIRPDYYFWGLLFQIFLWPN